MDARAPDFASWFAQVEHGLRGKGWQSLTWSTSDHFAIPPLVRREDVESLPHRRIESLLRSRRGFSIRELVVASDPQAAARRAARALQRGADEVEFCLDALAHDALSPGGSDPDYDDDAFATPSPGESGVPIHTRRDLEAALDGIDLAKTSLWFSAGEGALAVLIWWLRLARARRVPTSALRGGLDVDPVEQLLARRARNASGGAIASCRTSFDSVFDSAAGIVRWTRQHAPGIRPLVFDGQSHHMAGASPALELGLLLASIVEVARGLDRRGVAFTDLAAAATVRVQVGHELIAEIAKLRALRLCFAKLAAACGASGEALVPRVLALTSSRFRSDLYDHRTNLVRSSLAACAAVIGGCDSLIVLPFDGSEGDAARDLARDQGHLLRAEAQLARVADPAGGSGAVELLTHEIGRAAWSVMQEIEQGGGMVAAAKSGLAMQLVRRREQERDAAFRTRAKSLVGINRYVDAALGGASGEEFDLEAMERAAETAQRRFDTFVRRRNQPKVDAHLLAMRRAEPSRLLDVALGDPADDATLEELATATWPKTGHDLVHRWQPIAAADGHAFEDLRANADGHRAEGLVAAPVLLLSIGDAAPVVARAEFARDLLLAGGIVATERACASIADAQAAIRAEPPAVIVVCAPDEGAESLVEALRASCDALTPPLLIWSGEPRESLARVIDLAFHRGIDAVDALEKVQSALGLELDEMDEGEPSGGAIEVD